MALEIRSSGRQSRRKSNIVSSINVTPMVDVMLVLLVIFMVAAPMLTVGIKVDLPTTKSDQLPRDNKPIIVSIKSDASLYIGETLVTSLDNLPIELKKIAAMDSGIYIRGDKKIDYGKIMEVMAVIKSSGFTKISLVTMPMQ